MLPSITAYIIEVGTKKELERTIGRKRCMKGRSELRLCVERGCHGSLQVHIRRAGTCRSGSRNG